MHFKLLQQAPLLLAERMDHTITYKDMSTSHIDNHIQLAQIMDVHIKASVESMGRMTGNCSSSSLQLLC